MSTTPDPTADQGSDQASGDLAPVAVTGRGLLGHPRLAALRGQTVDAPPNPDGEVEDEESATIRREQRAQRRAAAATARRDAWAARVPRRFRSASLDGLRPGQGRVAGDDDNPRRYLHAWAADPDAQPVLWLHGPDTGTGKTWAAYAVAAACIEQGMNVDGGNIATLLDRLRPGREDDAMDHLCDVDVLVVDDLGGEQITTWTMERLALLVDTRWSEERRMILTTNLTPEQVVERYGQRIADRLTDDSAAVEFAGESLRGGHFT